MKTGLSVRKIVLCLIGIQLFYMASILLLERFFQGPVLLFGYVGLLAVLYYYHFAELKLWQKLFLHIKLPCFPKQLKSISHQLMQFSEQMKKHTLLYVSLAITLITAGISFLLLASVSILLVEVYWLTDFPLGNSFCPVLWGCIATLSKLVFVGFGWVTSSKEVQNEGQML